MRLRPLIPRLDRTRKPRGHGFTLIELLIVISLISILAAILFPVFARAREKARQAQAISKTKQQILGVLLYANDNADRLPLDIETVFPYVKSRYVLPISVSNRYSDEDTDWEYRYPPFEPGGNPAFDGSSSSIRSPSETILIVGKARSSFPFYIFGYADGHVKSATKLPAGLNDVQLDAPLLRSIAFAQSQFRTTRPAYAPALSALVQAGLLPALVLPENSEGRTLYYVIRADAGTYLVAGLYRSPDGTTCLCATIDEGANLVRRTGSEGCRNLGTNLAALIFNAQQAYRTDHSGYASTLVELGVAGLLDPRLAAGNWLSHRFSLGLTTTGFVATSVDALPAPSSDIANPSPGLSYFFRTRVDEQYQFQYDYLRRTRVRSPLGQAVATTEGISNQLQALNPGTPVLPGLISYLQSPRTLRTVFDLFDADHDGQLRVDETVGLDISSYSADTRLVLDTFLGLARATLLPDGETDGETSITFSDVQQASGDGLFSFKTARALTAEFVVHPDVAASLDAKLKSAESMTITRQFRSRAFVIAAFMKELGLKRGVSLTADEAGSIAFIVGAL